MSRKIKVAAVSLSFEDGSQTPSARALALKKLSEVLDSAKGYELDLLVLPENIEAAAQGIEQAEQVENPGPILNLYQTFAQDQKCTVAGSVRLREDSHIYNSLAYIDPDGTILGVYHKTNLTLGELEEGLTPGSGAILIDTPMGKAGSAICFDLNFVDLCEQYAKIQPDLTIFSSMYHGGLMQAHWAYRCRSYFIGATGALGSGILDPFGRPVQLTDCYTSMAMATIDMDYVLVHLDYHQEKFKAICRQYQEEVSVDIPANIGSALITSRSKKRSAMDIVREFKLELLHDYLNRSRKANTAALAF